MAVLASIIARVVLIGGRATTGTGGVPALALRNAGEPLLHEGAYLTQ